MNRRKFLGATAASAAWATDLLAASAEPISKITVGMLGASHSHAAEKLRLLRSHDAFEFVGAVESSERIRATHPAVAWIGRDELLARTEFIVVESAVRDHARDGLAALRAGKHVHLEKPPSAKWSEMLELVQAAREHNRLLQVGYMWRHNPGFQKIFEAARNGWLGEIVQVRAMMNNLLAPGLREEWAEFAGGAFFEQAAHLVDAAVRLLGKPSGVTSVLRSTKGDALVDNNAVIFEFPRALAIVTNSTSQPNAFAHRQFEVQGTNGTMLLKPLEPPALLADFAKAAGPYRAGTQMAELPKYERYRDEFDQVARCIRSGAALPVSLDEELLVQEWLLRACGMFDG